MLAIGRAAGSSRPTEALEATLHFRGPAGLAPFVLATPHHTPPGALAMQLAGLQPLHKPSYLDHLKLLFTDPTNDFSIKEIIPEAALPAFPGGGGTLAEGAVAYSPGGVVHQY